jgi:hypothetical protein
MKDSGDDEEIDLEEIGDRLEALEEIYDELLDSKEIISQYKIVCSILIYISIKNFIAIDNILLIKR